MITQEILIDVNNHIASEVVSRLGESNVRQLLIKPVFYNPDGTYTQIVIDSENVHGMFRMVKPDGTFVTTNMALATPSSNPAEFIVTLTGAMSQVAGRGYYDVRIGDTEDASEFIYSAQGLFTIDDDMITDEMIESVAEANGFIFPDDFLTSADLEDYVTEEELEDYATKTYVDNAIADIPDPLDNYSTTERVVGTWLDGVTKVYEKTYYVASPAKNCDTKIYDSTMQDISMCLLVTGTYKRISGGGTMTYALNGREGNYSNEDSFIRVDMPDSGNYGLTYYLKTDNNVFDLIVTIRYTKTD